jgi:hypothetical protein
MRNAHILVENLEVKRPLWRPMYKWKNNIKMGFKIGFEGVD